MSTEDRSRAADNRPDSTELTERPDADPTPVDSTVTMSVAEYRDLTMFATSWLRFWSGDALDDLVDQRVRAISHDLSGSARWSATGPRHAELARLRARPAWVSTCARPGCRWQETVYDRAEWAHWCPDHRPIEGQG